MTHLLNTIGLGVVVALLHSCSSPPPKPAPVGPDSAIWTRGMSREAKAGGVLFTQSGCLACHTYQGAGSRNLGAHDLTREGRKGVGVERLARYISNPAAFGNDVMPRFDRAFTPKQMRELAVFLTESR